MNEVERLREENALLRENLAMEHVKAAAIYRDAVRVACDEALSEYKHRLRACEQRVNELSQAAQQGLSGA